MNKAVKLLIAVPCMDYMHCDFVKSLNALTMHLCREVGFRQIKEVPICRIFLSVPILTVLSAQSVL